MWMCVWMLRCQCALACGACASEGPQSGRLLCPANSMSGVMDYHVVVQTLCWCALWRRRRPYVVHCQPHASGAIFIALYLTLYPEPTVFQCRRLFCMGRRLFVSRGRNGRPFSSAFGP
eukprot:324653-Chlamydomonas_euryale.AAC.2